MGSWGPAPWENDSAADWYADLFSACDIAKRVEETLSLDPEEYDEEIRAAASLLSALGRLYIWPLDSLPRLLSLAIAALTAIKESGIVEDSDAAVLLDEEIDTLVQRLASITRTGAPRSDPAARL